MWLAHSCLRDICVIVLSYISRCEKEYACAQFKSPCRLISIEISLPFNSTLCQQSHWFSPFQLPDLASNPDKWTETRMAVELCLETSQTWHTKDRRSTPVPSPVQSRYPPKYFNLNSLFSAPYPQPNPASECPCLPLPSLSLPPLLLHPSALPARLKADNMQQARLQRLLILHIGHIPILVLLDLEWLEICGLRPRLP